MLNTKNNQMIIVTASTDTDIYTCVNAYNMATSPWQAGMTWDCFWQAVDDLRALFDKLYTKGIDWTPLDTTDTDIIGFWTSKGYDIADIKNYAEWYYDDMLQALYKEIADDIYIEPITALHRVCGFYAKHSNVVYTVEWMPADYIF